MTHSRTTTVLASGAIAFALGLTGAPAALAEEAPAPMGSSAELRALPWPEYKEGDSAPQIAAASHLLRWTGHYKEKADEKFTKELTAAVKAFQADRHLPEDGVLGQETWGRLSGGAFGEVSLGMSGEHVKAIQYLLAHLHGAEVSVTGTYDEALRDAVREFQKSAGVAADGIVGPITWRALVSGGA
ncbi:peptidoglycan-binding domain-containing protein [Marinactinospora thermotolerans]|uniref:Peptidoglycan-binding (PGRP) domain of peptidoglycan hydrolases-containing protein n=1 Tax=Marinactinospora thermotolerans DSM 45154 TaxID=1122192 RepID=A0A1T4KSS7_9ACTN|nr:peptidoglycan-binding protein [Marinactinospora thermotolerans]SJZ45433.1 Peptidoglycan-binding (PGRP) domain of peptidoglycan hydrolases-containing protein [Marinactinospora thermotolerans DSM 45154]